MSRLTLFGLGLLLLAGLLFLLGFAAQVLSWLGEAIRLPYGGFLSGLRELSVFSSFAVLSVFAIVIFVDFVISMSRTKPGNIRYDPIKNPRISVVMTAWNDEKSIYDAVTDFKAQDNVIDVVVVENNSSDNTAKLAEKAGARVVTEKIPGYGSVCIRGLSEVSPRANIIVLVEGDMTYNGYDIRKLVPYLDNVDMVLGTRITQELLNRKTQLGWFGVWGNLFLAKLVQFKYWNFKMWGSVRLTDVGCTLRAIRAESLQKIRSHLTVRSNHFSPHMTMVALDNNLKVIEIPVTFRERVGLSKGAGRSNWKAFKIGLHMMKAILFS